MNASPAPAGRNERPEPWLVRGAALAPEHGPALDLACGGGRHGRWLLANGRAATFVDRDVSALADLAGDPGATLVQADLERGPSGANWPLGGRRFAVVAVVNYLWRPLLPRIVAAVAPGGVLIYQTFALGHERFGRPANPDFLLRPGELLDAVRGRLTVLRYEHGEGLIERPAVVQRVVAARAAG